MHYQIKELSLGGILDQAVQLTKNHFGLFFGIIAVLYLPFMLLTGIVTTSLLPELPPTPTMEDLIKYNEVRSQASIYIAPLNILLMLFITPVTNGAIISAVSQCYLGNIATIGSSYSHAFRIFLPLLGTWLLQGLATIAGLLLFIVGAIIFSLWFLLSTHVVVIGGESGTAALSRSKKLMKGNMGTGFALGFILIVIQWGILAATVAFPEKYTAMVGQSVLQSIAFLFSTVAFVVFYFSCRCKIENFDLDLLAENIGADGPSEADAEPTF